MATDTIRHLEERLARLEEELRKVKIELGKGKEPEQPWWEKIVGSAKDSKAYEAIVREMRKNRRADYEAACRAADAAEAAAKARRKARKTNSKG